MANVGNFIRIDYDSKWSTEFYKDCMFEFFVISLLRRLMIMFF